MNKAEEPERVTEPAASHSPEPADALREQFHAGSADAIDRLALAFHGDVLRFAMALLRDEEAAHEAVQETFLRLIERHALYDAGRPFRPWLFTVCRNCCLALLRERQKHKARVIDVDPTDREVTNLAAELPSAFETLLRAERETEALSALTDLPESKRTIIVLHLFEDMTFRDIAEIVGRPPNTVATLYYRALAELREALGPQIDAPAAASLSRRSRHAS